MGSILHVLCERVRKQGELVELIEELLESVDEASVFVNYRCEKEFDAPVGLSALMLACEGRTTPPSIGPRVIKLLLHYKADPFLISSNDKKSNAFFRCASQGSVDTMVVLYDSTIEYG